MDRSELKMCYCCQKWKPVEQLQPVARYTFGRTTKTLRCTECIEKASLPLAEREAQAALITKENRKARHRAQHAAKQSQKQEGKTL